MEIAIERVTGILLFVVALSHLLQPAGWTEFFTQLRAKGAPGAFINGMMSLWLGALIVGFHGDVWTGWPAIVTVVGWAQLIKGVPSNFLRFDEEVRVSWLRPPCRAAS